MTNPLDVYSGVANEKIAAYQAGALEERVLHMQTADPKRLPTYTLFPKPDYFFSFSTKPGTPNVSINPGFAYDHGYYSPNIDITWVGFAGKGVAVNGVDGPDPADGNQPSDPESKNTVPQASKVGTWVEETDIRPTMLFLTGLTDDYQSDGHVITQALKSVPGQLKGTEDLAAGYDQINSSVGAFATDTLLADTKALASGTSVERQRLHDRAAKARSAGRRPRRGRYDDQADAVGRRGRQEAETRPARGRTCGGKRPARPRAHARNEHLTGVGGGAPRRQAGPPRHGGSPVSFRSQRIRRTASWKRFVSTTIHPHSAAIGSSAKSASSTARPSSSPPAEVTTSNQASQRSIVPVSAASGCSHSEARSAARAVAPKAIARKTSNPTHARR